MQFYISKNYLSWSCLIWLPPVVIGHIRGIITPMTACTSCPDESQAQYTVQFLKNPLVWKGQIGTTGTLHIPKAKNLQILWLWESFDLTAWTFYSVFTEEAEWGGAPCRIKFIVKSTPFACNIGTIISRKRLRYRLAVTVQGFQPDFWQFSWKQKGSATKWTVKPHKTVAWGEWSDGFTGFDVIQCKYCTYWCSYVVESCLRPSIRC